MDRDGTILIDSSSSQKIIYNGFTFKEIIKGIIVEYAKKSKNEAESIINNFKYFSKPIETFSDAIFFSHETEYHWAMCMVYGDTYWLEGINIEPPNNYNEWESEYIAKKKLADCSFEFLN